MTRKRREKEDNNLLKLEDNKLKTEITEITEAEEAEVEVEETEAEEAIN